MASTVLYSMDIILTGYIVFAFRELAVFQDIWHTSVHNYGSRTPHTTGTTERHNHSNSGDELGKISQRNWFLRPEA